MKRTALTLIIECDDLQAASDHLLNKSSAFRKALVAIEKDGRFKITGDYMLDGVLKSSVKAGIE